jgi:hypothetical protein
LRLRLHPRATVAGAATGLVVVAGVLSWALRRFGSRVC